MYVQLLCFNHRLIHTNLKLYSDQIMLFFMVYLITYINPYTISLVRVQNYTTIEINRCSLLYVKLLPLS